MVLRKKEMMLNVCLKLGAFITRTTERSCRHINCCNEYMTKMILAPFGLEGRVTGREWSDAEPATARLLDAWRQLYPLEQACSALEVLWIITFIFGLLSIQLLLLHSIPGVDVDRLEHPVKRFKGEEKKLNEESAPSGDLYANEHYVRPPDCALMHDIKIEKQEPEDSKEYKNLFRSDGLCPTLKDLEQIFDNSDDANSGDETLQVSTPPDSNKSCEVRCVRAEELSKMFPTPPSMEPHAQASPGFSNKN
ncbi:unnamed protein product [Leptidea sinapis]|uniref:Mediator of RNA polymerase II transcription subunit 13 n=1 Tax=Leptidea sinapis TaxID=189913 RepID=A0A5E4PUS3_9NEOP|nr:unnamed protein product [Leptidea sinapis]